MQDLVSAFVALCSIPGTLVSPSSLFCSLSGVEHANSLLRLLSCAAARCVQNQVKLQGFDELLRFVDYTACAISTLPVLARLQCGLSKQRAQSTRAPRLVTVAGLQSEMAQEESSRIPLPKVEALPD